MSSSLSNSNDQSNSQNHSQQTSGHKTLGSDSESTNLAQVSSKVDISDYLGTDYSSPSLKRLSGIEDGWNSMQ